MPSPTLHRVDDDDHVGGRSANTVHDGKRARVDGGGSGGTGRVGRDTEGDEDAAQSDATSIPTRTFLPLMEQMDPETLKTMLGPGWVVVDMDEAFAAGYVDLVFLDGFKNFERKLWSLKCGVRCVLMCLSA